jgi:hypothetical protein
MNYYEARERSDGSGWAWTRMNDGVIRTAGGCVTWPEGHPTPEQAISGTGPKPGQLHAHATREEAERCFYDYEAANLVELHAEDTQEHCQFPGCQRWTSDGLAAHLLGEAILCDEHRNADGWKAINPFHPGLRIASSY